jgi:fatty acid desaturase
MRGLFAAARSSDRRARRTFWKIMAVQAVLLAAAIASGHWWVYPVLWVLPYLTVWRVINRLRSIAEHGGMMMSSDRRETTHSVAQSPLARFALVPYRIGWHLAHHVDSGIPFRNLPKLHRMLHESGYVDATIEYPSYTALWRKLASGATQPR